MWERIIAFFTRNDHKSSKVAKERLRLVLIQDRSQLSPDRLEELKNELIKIIKKFVPIDENMLTVGIEGDRDKMALIANIPLRRSEEAT